MATIAELLNPATTSAMQAMVVAGRADKKPAQPNKITKTHIKEKNMYDLDNLTDAELGALVRKQMKAMKGEEIIEKAPEVEAERQEHEAEQVKQVKAEQEARKERILLGFTVGNCEVPDLDLTNVSSLDEAPDAKTRSPYNRCRYRLGIKETLDPEVTTYRFLMEEHERLAALASEKASKPVESKKAKKPEPEVAVVVTAKLDKSEKAKAKVLAEVLGVSKKEARKMVEAMK